MGNCIIHVGMHRTGSSSIQRSLHGFSNGEIVYGQFGKQPNHSIPLSSLFAPDPATPWLHQLAGRTGEQLQSYIDRMRIELENNLANAGDRTLLFSGEAVSLLPQEGLQKLHAFLKSRFENISVVAYIRPPAGYISSSFQQRLRAGGHGGFEPIYRSYKKSFSGFDEVFGQENVLLWKFSPETFPGNCVVRDFCRRLGIALPASRIIRINESMSREIATLLYIYSKFAEDLGFEKLTVRMSLNLIGGLSGVGGVKFRFAPSLIGPLLEKNQEDIEWMEARLGQPLKEDFSRDRPGDIGEESDLLTPDPAIVQELRERLGEESLCIEQRDPLHIVVALVHAFLNKKRERDRRPF
jgi:hypothetical protein